MNERFSARIAEAYGSHSGKYASVLEPILKPMADEIVSMAGLNGGELLLDLAIGTGLIARTAAKFTDIVIGIDISLGILRKAHTLSAGLIPFVAGDALRLPFDDGCFDLVTCGLSLSHFPDVTTALEEIRRILRPWGRFLTSAWGVGGESPAKTAAVEVRKRFLEDREAVFEGTFNEEVWADVGRGCQTLKEAGFTGVQVTTETLSGEYRNHEDAIKYTFAWPLTRYRIGRLDPEDQRRLREETGSAILEVDDLRWDSEVHYYKALRPGD